MTLVESRVKMSEYASNPLERGAIDHDDTPFLIKRDGCWLYKGASIEKKSMVCLFSSLLTRDQEGQYFLESPFESVQIDVEDAPLVVVAMKWRGCGSKQELSFLTNTDECITAGQEHPLRMAKSITRADPVPYLHIRNGKGSFPLEARLNRATYYELMALAEPGVEDGQDVLGLWSGGVFFPIGNLSE